MKNYFTLLLSFFPLFFTLAQNKQSDNKVQIENIRKQLKEINQDINERKGDPEQQEMRLFQIKKISEELNYDRGTFESGSLIMMLYAFQGRTQEIITLGKQLKKAAQGKKDPYGAISSIYRRNALALGQLGLDDESIKDFRTSIKYIQTIENKDIRLYYLSMCYENMTVFYDNKQFDKKFADSIVYFRKKSLAVAKQITDGGAVPSNLKYEQIAFANMAIGVFYLGKEDTRENTDTAEKYLLEGLKIIENKKYNITPETKIRMLNQVSWLYSEKLDYKTSIDYAQRALELEKQFNSPNDRVESYEFLADSYTGIGDSKKAKFYLDKYSYLKDSLHVATKNNADFVMKSKVTDGVNLQKEKSKKLLIIIFSLICVFIIIVILLWRRKKRNLHKKYEEIIHKINTRKETPVKSIETIKNNENKSPAIIPEDTAKILLEKLERFEASEKYLKKEVSLPWLANYLNTNTKYLSEIIKTERGKNFSNYINGLRINFIVDKLYNEPIYREYKISYLAEASGFTTHKVFVTAFKNEHGVTPSYFIEKLRASE
ncbi:helix-turn-helix domain-containing protein [Chryseobacterium arthrosphaerae]|uniref:helix-turn-helix domain-containing protein n=1 Tax=Chryseobacterium arthrosphaerae TaxID=651561 RepID=UPI001F4A8A27|nr:helix-turn-helix domain-containing protein [Chryseobacterium arthrosphaerae]MDG4653232.1 helix-turn-helix domain-containing protein [Chryseobacterium arthrosphaerae]